MKEDFIKKAKEIVSLLTTEEKLSFLTTKHRPVERLGIKEFNVGTEIARGFVGRDKEKYSTVFPQPVGLAGTFDTELMEELGRIASDETRAYYNEDNISPFLYGPTVDMERHSLWGRTEEAYGEDVCLAGEMTRAYTTGLFGDNGTYCKTIPTLKHFCANNNEDNRGNCNAYIPLRLRYEYYYASFMNAIKYGGAKCVMASYNKINGIPGLCNPDLKSLGTWFAISDGGAFSMNMTEHNYCQSHSETFAEALHAGCIIMLEPEEVTINAGKKALEKGLVTENEVNEAVEKVLYMRMRLGESADNCTYNNITKSVLDSEESAQLNLRATREQVVLLENNGMLPLKEKPKKIAVLGALADENFMDWYTGYFRNAVSIYEGIKREFPDSEVTCFNGWDIVAIKAHNGKYISVHDDGTVRADADEVTESELFEWQDWGDNWRNLFSVKYQKYLAFDNKSLKLNKRHIYSWFTYETFNFHRCGSCDFIIEDFKTHCRLTCSENGQLTFSGNQPQNPENSFTVHCIKNRLSALQELAENADMVIYCMGNNPLQYAKEAHDRKSLGEDSSQMISGDIIRYVNDKMITVLVSSYPQAIKYQPEYHTPILYTTHAGANLGTAIAETISGKNNPSGRLSMTWYNSDLDLPDIMNYDIEKTGSTYMYFKGTPLYPFGYGLSYSVFEYKEITVSEKSVEITLENTSDTDGDEVVQLYFTVPHSAVSRPLKKLCGFTRVHLKAHEEKTVHISVIPDILMIYDVRQQKMITESGSYIFMAGGSSDNLPLSAEIYIEGEQLCGRNSTFEAQCFDSADNYKICWSKKLRRHYICSEAWENNAVYSGIDFSGKTSVKLSVCSVYGDGDIYIRVGEKSYCSHISASDSYDDFKEYTLPIESSDTDTLSVYLPNNTCLLDIKIM